MIRTSTIAGRTVASAGSATDRCLTGPPFCDSSLLAGAPRAPRHVRGRGCPAPKIMRRLQSKPVGHRLPRSSRGNAVRRRPADSHSSGGTSPARKARSSDEIRAFVSDKWRASRLKAVGRKRLRAATSSIQVVSFPSPFRLWRRGMHTGGNPRASRGPGRARARALGLASSPESSPSMPQVVGSIGYAWVARVADQ